MVAASAFAYPKYCLDETGHLPEKGVFEHWLQDPEVGLMEKVHGVALLQPKSACDSLDSSWKTNVSWLRDPKEPLLGRIGLVFGIALMAIAACFALTIAHPILGVYGSVISLLGGAGALFIDLSRPTVAQVEKRKEKQLESWTDLVQAIGGIDNYYQIPVMKFPSSILTWPLYPQDLPAPIVKGLDLMNRPFIILKLKDKTNQQEFSIAFDQGAFDQGDYLSYRCTHQGADFQKFCEISRAPIPEKDKRRYRAEIPKEDLQSFDSTLRSTFPYPVFPIKGSPSPEKLREAREKTLASLHQIVVEKNHPHFQLVEAQ